MRHGTVVFRDFCGKPCGSKDFVAGCDKDLPEPRYEPSDDVVAWLLGEYKAYRRSILPEEERKKEGG